MSEMVERVAKAMLDCPLDGTSEPLTLRDIIEFYYTGVMNDEAPQSAKDAANEFGPVISRAVIEEMRHPTDEMLAARMKGLTVHDANATWQMMIDVALK